jgi:TatD DNase family protein
MAASDPDAVLRRAVAAGVDWLVCPGTDADGSEAARDLARRHPDRVLWAAGLHPHDAARWQEERDRIAALAAEACAVGEVGLDFYRNLSPRALQMEAFRDQVGLAVALDKPVVVHTRDSFAEVFDIVESSGTGPRTVLHCWTGGRRWTRRFRDLGVTFSFAGPLTFEGGETVRLAATEAPPDRTMVETDTPYLTPPPDRRAPNEPANVVKVGHALAEVWGMPPDEVARLTSATAAGVFGRG